MTDRVLIDHAERMPAFVEQLFSRALRDYLAYDLAERREERALDKLSEPEGCA